MAYNTPGVYVEEISSLPPSVAGVATAIPAFIGYTQQAMLSTAGDLTLKPTRIAAMVDYEKHFGGADPELKIKVTIASAADGSLNAVATLAEADRSHHLMWYALRLYFDNGGGPCYICSVGGYGALDLTELENGLTAVGKEDEPTLLVFPEAQYLDIADCKSLYDQALQQCAALQNRFVIMDVHGGAVSLNDPGADINTAVKNFRDNGTPANNLKYGAAYAPNLETTVRFAYDDTQTHVIVGAADSTLDTLETTNTQNYNLALGAINKLTCKLPPSGAVAGIYAAVDNARGVWKAPANLSVADAIQPTIAIDSTTQDSMNVDSTSGKSVNAIRAFTGVGTLVWGARTLAGNDNEWRYVNVRRFCIFAEESIRRATRQFVFEPNDANTWVKVKGMIENFLTSLWRQGALMGAKTSDAFSVQVSLGSTMTALDVLEGRMVVVVGLCPVRPAEFIVLRFVQTMPVS
ncbi:phage tail sheath C-terminal domain-containing protein [Rhodanobacter sp. AS-Z3]|uniref:phage tail sheath family protein n=1 Tax=Rhodanobacter sp. AS-Z3 TaxID=3031330 RepID=UPI00247B0B54|nr:phage tail sheath C-terminal domain-containing protein [Rhodanobacter sp. AS-Z3]WEN13748.1 phage tail sheath C-terminal domain-containing protein [Rhodanobacter sp. AS-Z3]